MNLDQVAAELGAALRTITGLRVPAWGVESISPPAAVVALPEEIEYDFCGYNRGADRYGDMAVIVLVAKPEERSSRKRIAAYADGAGPKSVKQALEGFTYTTCDVVTVKRAEFDNATYAGTPYLAAIFHVDIVGKAV